MEKARDAAYGLIAENALHWALAPLLHVLCGVRLPAADSDCGNMEDVVEACLVRLKGGAGEGRRERAELGKGRGGGGGGTRNWEVGTDA